MLMEKEIWKDIPWWEWYYKVSSLWNVYSYRRNINLSLIVDNLWYIKVSFWKNWKCKNAKVHRLVALAFIPQIEWKYQVNHKDGIKTNNHISNLEWMNHSENNKHAFDFLWRKSSTAGRFWILHIRSKIVVQMDHERNIIAIYWSTCEAWRKLWLWQSYISACCNKKNKKNKDYIFEFWDKSILDIYWHLLK